MEVLINVGAFIVLGFLHIFSGGGGGVSAYNGNSIFNVTTDLKWWQKAVFYQIYPRSFQDSDGDGIGDLKGITSRLNYLDRLGIDCIWLSPICRSPMKDFGYDCSDAMDIDPIFGNLQDFQDLLSQVHSRRLKLIVDFVPGYTSDQHIWFQRSVRREGKYSNYYTWNDGKKLDNGTRVPPNNWLSIFGGPAWTWNEIRQQYFYHVFIKESPQLNHRDDNLQWELKSIMRFWLDQGVDGFRADAITNILTVSNFSLDEPRSGNDVPPDQEDYLDHIYTQNQPGVAPILKGWYDLLDEYTMKDNKDRQPIPCPNATREERVLICICSRIRDNPHDIRNSLYAQGEGNPFNFDLLQMSRPPTTREVYKTIMEEYNNLLPGKWPNFVLGNHDNTRVSERNGYQYVDAYNMLLLTLKGTPTTYYGEELGMLQADISWNMTQDPWGLNFGPDRYQNFSRDPERSPMQWTDGPQAGFTSGNSTWLPLGQNYTTLNVQTETMSTEYTSLKLYSDLNLLRDTFFIESSFKVELVTDDIISYLRQYGQNSFLIVLNFGNKATVDLSSVGGLTGTVLVASPRIPTIRKGSTVGLTNITLDSGDGLVISLHPQQPDEIVG